MYLLQHIFRPLVILEGRNVFKSNIDRTHLVVFILYER